MRGENIQITTIIITEEEKKNIQMIAIISEEGEKYTNN